MPRGRPKKTAQERLDYCKRHNIVVDKQDQWLLSAFTWHITQDNQVRVAVFNDRKRCAYMSLGEAVMGPPPPGKIWRRHNAKGHNYRRNNLYIAEYKLYGKQVKEQQQRRFDQLLRSAVAAVDAASSNGSGCSAGRVRLHTVDSVRNMSDVVTGALWSQQDDVEQRQGDGT